MLRVGGDIVVGCEIFQVSQINMIFSFFLGSTGDFV